jgi:hypothetical protein
VTKCLAGLLLSLTLSAQEPGAFDLIGKYHGLGSLVASAVGPGREPGTERFYLSYLYVNHTIDVVALDPRTGDFEVFPNPAAGESGARCIAVGPDGNIYLGTLARAHFLKLDVKAGKLIDLGRPSLTEQYIWDVAFGPDGKLYGATYPQSKLVRYDPQTGRLEDLGRMDPVELYAHYVAGSDDGFMYVGIGTSKTNVAAYEIATGEHREILPSGARIVGQARVHRGIDGNVYGTNGPRWFRCKGWTATEIAAKDVSPAAPLNRLQDGSTVAVKEGAVALTDPKGKTTEKPYLYEGNELDLFRVAFGPDGELYASAVLPIHLVKYDRESRKLRNLGGLGGGEIYSFLARQDKLLAAAYSGFSPLMIYDPAMPFHQGSGEKNPALVNFSGSDSGWRPQAFIAGPGGKAYLGSVAGYGKLGGPLSVWDVDTGAVEQFHHLVPDQSVVSLAEWKGRIVGGTTIGGGGGSHPTQKEARLFLWNPETKEKEFEMTPVAGEGAINDLILAPNGLVYGVAGSTLFAFDPESKEIKARSPLPFRGTVYSSVALGPDGRIWGLAPDGIFAIDTLTHSASLVARSPERITAGFALRDGAIWFVSGATVYRYNLPRN